MQIDIHSELPFALINKGGEQVAQTTSAVKSKPKSDSQTSDKAKASLDEKRAAKKTTKIVKSAKGRETIVAPYP